MSREQPFIVVDTTPFERRMKPDGMPTPRLISEGGGEAYFRPWGDGVEGGQWRARDDKYDPPGTVYKRVRVIRNPKADY